MDEAGERFGAEIGGKFFVAGEAAEFGLSGFIGAGGEDACGFDGEAGIGGKEVAEDIPRQRGVRDRQEPERERAEGGIAFRVERDGGSAPETLAGADFAVGVDFFRRE